MDELQLCCHVRVLPHGKGTGSAAPYDGYLTTVSSHYSVGLLLAAVVTHLVFELLLHFVLCWYQLPAYLTPAPRTTQLSSTV